MAISWTALVYIVLNALSYSAVDLLRKMLVRGVRPVPLLFFLSAGQLPFFLAWAWAAGSLRTGPGYLPLALGSVLLNVAANLLFLEAVRLSPLSLTIPFLSLTPVFTTLLAIPLLGELPSPRQFLGILLVVAGAFRLNLRSGESGSPGGLWRAFRREKGSVLMTLVAVCWSLATPLDKLAMARAEVSLHGLVLNAGVGLGVLAMLLVRGRQRELLPPPGTGRQLLLAIVASVLGLAFLLLAINAAWVGLVETGKRAIGSLLALLLGAIFFAERISLNQLGGVVLMTVGVALVVI